MAQVLIISNRLPVSVKKVDGELQFSESLGGLATGLSSYVKDRQNKWIGWPGLINEELTDKDRQQIIRELHKRGCSPVFLDKKEVDDFYNGYSNGVLWPLFHNLPFKPAAGAQHKRWWQAYRSVNRQFAEAVLDSMNEDSLVWVHDYQLLLLPGMIRQERPAANIGFFLHIPFPDAKVFSKLPEAKRLLLGVLGADVVGFHTPSYVANFSAGCQEQGLGQPVGNQIVLGNRTVRIADFPMGIDYEKYAAAGKTKAVKQAYKRYKRRYRRLKVIVAVDRLDISKGLVERLKAYREFLRQNPKLHGKVIMAMVAAPSRTDIPAYQNLKKRVDKLAAEINAEFGTPRWQPLDYMNTAKPFEEVTALFQLADVAFIAPLRDGMNLVAKEYVASRRKNGVLILSETAGAAEELRDALIVNPRKMSSSVDALQHALTMPKRELRKRLGRMKKQIAANTVHHWARTFVETLNQPVPGTPVYTRTLNGSRLRKLMSEYAAGRKRLLLFDYDGTLVGLRNNFGRAKPSKTIIETVKKLCADPHNEVVIVSGRAAADLDKAFKDLRINLVAEHGAMYKRAGREHWTTVEKAESRWKRSVLPLLEQYAELTPAAMVEVKPHSLVWHYRQSPPYYAQKYSVVLKRALRPVLKKHGLAQYQGKKIIEIKNPHINKGEAISLWLHKKHDFILAIGDDYTDEDMFKVLPDTAFAVKIGRGLTSAGLRLPDHTAAAMLLRQLAA